VQSVQSWQPEQFVQRTHEWQPSQFVQSVQSWFPELKSFVSELINVVGCDRG